jgi:hypothetical protein
MDMVYVTAVRAEVVPDSTPPAPPPGAESIRDPAPPPATIKYEIETEGGGGGTYDIPPPEKLNPPVIVIPMFVPYTLPVLVLGNARPVPQIILTAPPPPGPAKL